MDDNLDKGTGGRRKPVVTIVDDEPIGTETLASFLKLEKDYEIQTYQSGTTWRSL